jgi:hypothetical protein
MYQLSARSLSVVHELGSFDGFIGDTFNIPNGFT